MCQKDLFLAPAAGGKSAYMVELARKTAVSLHAEVRICVPTGLQARAWQQRLAAAGGAIGVHVLTFDELVATCLNIAGAAYTELSEPVQYRLLRTIIDRLPLRYYEPLQDKPGFVPVVQQLIAELKSARVDPARLAGAVDQMGAGPRLQELSDIYAAYQDQLQAAAWADRVGLHWLAVAVLNEQAPDACRDWPLLIIDGFDDFAATQLALVQLLANRVRHFILTLPQAEQVTYPRYENTRQMVEAALEVKGVPLPEPDPGQPGRHPGLHHLSHHLFTLSAAAEPVAAADALALQQAPDRAAEARSALRWLKQRIVWDGVSPRQVALLARDVVPYRPFIRQIAAEFGLPIRLVDGIPLAQSPVIAALLSLLRLFLPRGERAEPDLPRRQAVAVWRSPYFYWGDEDKAITLADADALDALARRYRVIRGLSQWQAAFSAAAAASAGKREEAAADGGDLPGVLIAELESKFSRFLGHARPPADAATMRAFVQWLETLIGPDPEASNDLPSAAASLRIVAQARLNPTTAVADVAALRALKEILRSLVWAEAAVGNSSVVDYPHFLGELSGAVAAVHYTLPARQEQAEILVTNVANARGLSFAAVAVIGLSEGAFPVTISEDPFLRDADRQVLRDQSGFPLTLSTQSAEREFFYEAVTRARDKLLLTRPMLADNGAEWVASPFWEETRRLVAVEPDLLTSAAVVPPAETASWAEWWETAVSMPGSTQPPAGPDPAIWHQIATAARVRQSRDAAATAVWEGDLSSLADELAVRFDPNYLWSASRLEAYQTCGFLFFLQYVLDLEPRLEPAEGLDARQLGTLYHDIFEEVMEAGLPDPPLETAVHAHVTAVSTSILDQAPETLKFRETAWWAQTRAEIVENVTRSVLLLAQDDYEFLQAEARFGMEGPPLVIRDGADQLRLRGLIDRVDRRSDGKIRIVDYKLAGKGAYTAAAFREGRKLQLPLYALAAQQTLRLGTVADGFYWHFRQGEPSSFMLEKASGGPGGAIETAVAHAWDAVRHIRHGHFQPRPPSGGCPSYCPAAAFCWQYTPRNW